MKFFIFVQARLSSGRMPNKLTKLLEIWLKQNIKT